MVIQTLHSKAFRANQKNYFCKEKVTDDRDVKITEQEIKRRTPKNLVLCFDGTENEFGLRPFTNVLKLFRILEKESADQLCYYQPGVGVKFLAESNRSTDKNFISSKIGKVHNKLDAMFAFSLSTHVIAAYIFLMRFYIPGDKLYLFGFR